MKRYLTGLLWIAIFLLMTMQTGRAHGGIIIDTGFTDHFEWLVAVDPFPTLIGDVTLTLLVYDILTYEPVNDLTVTLHLTAPDDPQPCCERDTTADGIPLIVDPEIYPGDYSNVVAFEQPGDWVLQFVAESPAVEKSLDVTVTLPVNATMGGSEPIAVAPETTPDVDATATAFAANVEVARQVTSPLAAPISPLVTPILTSPETPVVTTINTSSGPNWLLWGGLGLIPLLLIGWLILRSPVEQDDSN